MSTKAYVVFLGSLAFTIVTFIQYRIWFPDLDKLIAYVGLGVLGMTIGWLIAVVENVKEDVKGIRNDLDYVEEKAQDIFKGKEGKVKQVTDYF